MGERWKTVNDIPELHALLSTRRDIENVGVVLLDLIV